jgi:hypothetical protein
MPRSALPAEGRESQWTDAVAVGTKTFVESVQQQFPDRRRWQIDETVFGDVSASILREPTPLEILYSRLLEMIEPAMG